MLHGAVRIVVVFICSGSCDGQAELSPQGIAWKVAADQRMTFTVMLDSVARCPGRWR